MATKNNSPRIAALTVEVIAGASEFQLLPAGHFRAQDGRPKDAPSWFIDSQIAATLIAQVANRGNPMVIDYEHQTLASAQNGQPAPASGWFKQLEWRKGDGLYAINVEWTDRAASMIAASEYRYISPVFTYDQQGNVTSILHAALTNNPALDDMSEVMLTAASRLVSLSSLTTTEESNMDELLERLRWLLNLPISATAADIIAELDKLKAQLSEGGTAAASFDLIKFVSEQGTRIAALTASVGTPDPAQFVPINVVTQMQGQIAALTTQISTLNTQTAGREIDGIVTAALSDGRLLPAQEAWARDLARDNVAALKSFLASAPRIAALTGTQTGGNPPPENRTQLTADELAVCKALGQTPEVYAKHKDAK